MRRQIGLVVLAAAIAFRVKGADVYGAASTAQTIALGGIYLGSKSPIDALAANPGLLTSIGRPYVEVTGLGVLAEGQFHNSTSYVGRLESNAGVSASAGFGMQIPRTRLSVRLGVFPVSLLSDRWKLQDPPGTGGASYGIQSEKSAFVAIQSAVGLAFQISRCLSVGAAFGVIDNFNTLEMPYVFQSNPTLAGLKTELDLHTRGIGYNGTFGLVAKPVRRLEFGLGYKTRTSVNSTGTASGNAYAQFAVLGLPFASGFHYKAEVDNAFPQSASVSVAWQARPRLRTYLQGDWLDWRGAFVQLPVHLSEGDNALLNSLLKSRSLNDTVPLHWKNQLVIRTGLELSLRESLTLQGAYSHGNAPVPSSTLTPLNAVIMGDALSAGLAYQKSRYRIQFAYQVNPPESASVATSALRAGEFSGTRTSLWLQMVALTTGIRF